MPLLNSSVKVAQRPLSGGSCNQLAIVGCRRAAHRGTFAHGRGSCSGCSAGSRTGRSAFPLGRRVHDSGNVGIHGTTPNSYWAHTRWDLAGAFIPLPRGKDGGGDNCWIRPLGGTLQGDRRALPPSPPFEVGQVRFPGSARPSPPPPPGRRACHLALAYAVQQGTRPCLPPDPTRLLAKLACQISGGIPPGSRGPRLAPGPCTRRGVWWCTPRLQFWSRPRG